VPAAEAPRVGYVLKMYPRFSETFIVNELLAHEEAGLELDVFSLRPPADGRFHPALARVRAPVTYLVSSDLKAQLAWDTVAIAQAELPGVATHLGELLAADVRDAVQALELAVLVRRRGITHLHAHFGSVATTVTRLAAHAKDIFHDSVDHADLARKLRDAVSVATVSDFNLRHLRATYGDDAARVERVYNGLALDEFPYTPPRTRPPVVAAVGRLVEKKGFPALLDACTLLVRRGVDFRCRIVGTGEQEDLLRVHAAALGLDGYVEFTGALPQDQVKALVAEAAVFAAPCVVGRDGNRDGLPTVLLEAMALGTPCVATDVTGIPEVLEDGRTGLMVEQHDSAGLADAIERLLGDADLRVGLASRARARMERDFDVRRQTTRLREHFASNASAASATAPTPAARLAAEVGA